MMFAMINGTAFSKTKFSQVKKALKEDKPEYFNLLGFRLTKRFSQQVNFDKL